MTAMTATTPEARLLVVEDEPNILELLSASLRLAGFEVATATGGLEALQAVQRHRPDLIVLDVMLPDLDGFDVARRLRSGDTRTPVLFLTAKDATEDKVTGLTVGGDDYVTKPFSLEEVIARIRACCAGPAPAARPRPRPGCGPPTWSWTRRAMRSGGPASWSSCPRPSSSCCAT